MDKEIAVMPWERDKYMDALCVTQHDLQLEIEERSKTVGQMSKIHQLIDEYECLPPVHKKAVASEMEELKVIVNWKPSKDENLVREFKWNKKYMETGKNSKSKRKI